MPFQTPSGKLFYRVGDVIISTNSENPSKWYGGTWELFAPGRTIVCIDTSQTEFNTIKKTGGNKNMQQHTHGGTVGSGGSHAHSASTNTASLTGTMRTYAYNGWGASGIVSYGGNGKTNSMPGGSNVGGVDASINASHAHSVTVNSGGSHNHTLSINNAGSGNAQNLQPYVVVYMWIRTA